MDQAVISESLAHPLPQWYGDDLSNDFFSDSESPFCKPRLKPWKIRSRSSYQMTSIHHTSTLQPLSASAATTSSTSSTTTMSKPATTTSVTSSSSSDSRNAIEIDHLKYLLTNRSLNDNELRELTEHPNFQTTLFQIYCADSTDLTWRLSAVQLQQETIQLRIHQAKAGNFAAHCDLSNVCFLLRNYLTKAKSIEPKEFEQQLYLILSELIALDRKPSLFNDLRRRQLHMEDCLDEIEQRLDYVTRELLRDHILPFELLEPDAPPYIAKVDSIEFDPAVCEMTPATSTVVPLTDLNVIIGPNNSGKSTLVTNIIDQLILSRDPNGPAKPQVELVKSLKVPIPSSFSSFLNGIAGFRNLRTKNGGYPDWMKMTEPTTAWTEAKQRISKFPVTNSDVTDGPSLSDFPLDARSFFDSSDLKERTDFIHIAIKFFQQYDIVVLSSSNRLDLFKPHCQPSPVRSHPGLQLLPDASPSHLIRVSDVINSVFGHHILVDNFADYSVFIGPKRQEELFQDMLNRTNTDPFKSLQSLDDQGDGLRSFYVIVYALVVLVQRIFIIDEPELHLHPPHAYAMGVFLAEQAREGKQIIISTHSPELIRGCMAGATNPSKVQFIRLERAGLSIASRTLVTPFPSGIVTQLRSQPRRIALQALAGLFYRKIIVVEGESDVLFYSELLRRYNPMAFVHFISTGGKPAILDVVNMYSEWGIRMVCGIVDFDVLLTPDVILNQTKQYKSLDPGAKQQLQRSSDKIASLCKANDLTEDMDLIQVTKELFTNNMLGFDQIDPATNGSRQTLQKLLKETYKALEKSLEQCEPKKELKQSGILAPPFSSGSASGPEALAAYEHLNQFLSESQIFVHPFGAVEASLDDPLLGASRVARPVNQKQKKKWMESAMDHLRQFDFTSVKIKDESTHPICIRHFKRVADFLKIPFCPPTPRH